MFLRSSPKRVVIVTISEEPVALHFWSSTGQNRLGRKRAAPTVEAVNYLSLVSYTYVLSIFVLRTIAHRYVLLLWVVVLRYLRSNVFGVTLRVKY